MTSEESQEPPQTAEDAPSKRVIPYRFDRDTTTASIIERFAAIEDGTESGTTVAVAVGTAGGVGVAEGIGVGVAATIGVLVADVSETGVGVASSDVQATATTKPTRESVSARERPTFPPPMPPPTRIVRLPGYYTNANEIGGFPSVLGLGGTRYPGDGSVAFLYVEVDR